MVKVHLKMLCVMNLTILLVKCFFFFTATKLMLNSNKTKKHMVLNIPLNDCDVNLMQSH